MRTLTLQRWSFAAAALAAAACSGAAARDASSGARAPAAAGRTTGGTLAAPAPAPRTELTLAAGTTLALQSDAELTSRHNHTGDPVTATSGAAVIGTLGDTLIPAGATFHGRITAIAHAPRPDAPGTLKLEFSEVRFGGRVYPVHGEVVSLATAMRGRGVTGGTVAKVGAGAVIGGIAGRLIGGGGTGTVVGAVVGGAGGAVVAHATRTMDVVLPAGGAIRFRLSAPFVREVAARG